MQQQRIAQQNTIATSVSYPDPTNYTGSISQRSRLAAEADPDAAEMQLRERQGDDVQEQERMKPREGKMGLQALAYQRSKSSPKLIGHNFQPGRDQASISEYEEQSSAVVRPA